MSAYTLAANHVATSLTLLSGYRHSPEVISDGYQSGRFMDHDIVMTSMGNRRKAIITPMYHALPLENNLADRLEWAGNYRRPLVEAVVSFDRRARNASVLLRLCLLPMVDEPRVVETAWTYPLGIAAESVNTFDEVVDEIAIYSRNGQPTAARTGFVVVTRDRADTSNWMVSTYEDPNEIARIMHSSISEELAFAL